MFLGIIFWIKILIKPLFLICSIVKIIYRTLQWNFKSYFELLITEFNKIPLKILIQNLQQLHLKKEIIIQSIKLLLMLTTNTIIIIIIPISILIPMLMIKLIQMLLLHQLVKVVLLLLLIMVLSLFFQSH